MGSEPRGTLAGRRPAVRPAQPSGSAPLRIAPSSVQSLAPEVMTHPSVHSWPRNRDISQRASYITGVGRILNAERSERSDESMKAGWCGGEDHELAGHEEQEVTLATDAEYVPACQFRLHKNANPPEKTPICPPKTPRICPRITWG